MRQTISVLSLLCGILLVSTQTVQAGGQDARSINNNTVRTGDSGTRYGNGTINPGTGYPGGYGNYSTFNNGGFRDGYYSTSAYGNPYVYNQPYYSSYGTPYYSTYGTPSYSTYGTPSYSGYFAPYSTQQYYFNGQGYTSPGTPMYGSQPYTSMYENTYSGTQNGYDSYPRIPGGMFNGSSQSYVRAPVYLRVSLPESATLTVEGVKTTETGGLRMFVSPPIDPGYDYVYDVTATWKEGDKEVTRTKKVHVAPGNQFNVDFQMRDEMKPTNISKPTDGNKTLDTTKPSDISRPIDPSKP